VLSALSHARPRRSTGRFTGPVTGRSTGPVTGRSTGPVTRHVTRHSARQFTPRMRRHATCPPYLLGLLGVLLLALLPASPASAQSASDFAPVPPARLADSRAGASTIDGLYSGFGKSPAAGGTAAINVSGRGGIPADAAAVVLNVTVTSPDAGGYVTVWPCGGAVPVASNLNFTTDTTIANLVITKVGTNGQVCVFANTSLHLIIDVTGFYRIGSSLVAAVPARLADSRPNAPTIDGQFSGFGKSPTAGNALLLTVTGRAGVPSDAKAVALNVTVTGPDASGFVTVYPCGSSQPNASNLNFTANQTIPNLVISKVGTGGKVCIATSTAAHLVVDVTAYFTASSPMVPITPQRSADSRDGGTTIDGQFAGFGRSPAVGGVAPIVLAGRGAVPVGATAAILNITVTDPAQAGYVTVWPCGDLFPNSSTLNFAAGQTIPNSTIMKLGTSLGNAGRICIYVSTASNLIVDVTAYY
jgi:hypothetical protein